MMIILVYGFFCNNICVLVNTGLTLTFGQTAQLHETLITIMVALQNLLFPIKHQHLHLY